MLNPIPLGNLTALKYFIVKNKKDLSNCIYLSIVSVDFITSMLMLPTGLLFSAKNCQFSNDVHSRQTKYARHVYTIHTRSSTI